MTRYRAGSRIQSMWEVYQEKGPNQAIELGRTLNLAEGTMRSWIRAWTKEGSGAPLENGTPAPRKMVTKSTVTITYDPERVAYLITEGDEQSLIRWEDNGTQQHLCNRHIKELADKYAARVTSAPKRIFRGA